MNARAVVGMLVAAAAALAAAAPARAEGPSPRVQVKEQVRSAEASATQTPLFTEVSGPELQMDGQFTAIVGQFTSDLLQDIIWYSPTGTDYLWVASGNRSKPFNSRVLATQISGTYIPIVGDFSGSSRDDILWYRPGTATDSLWTTSSAAWTSKRVTINGRYEPIVAHRNTGVSPVRDAIFWRAQGQTTIPIWSFKGEGAYTSSSQSFRGFDQSLPGLPRVAVGPVFNSFNNDDMIWYGPGAAKDAFWRLWGGSLDLGTYPSETAFSLGGDYVPLISDFRDPACPATGTCMYVPSDDVLWLNDSGTDALWESTESGFEKVSVEVPPGRAVPIRGQRFCCTAGYDSRATTILVNTATGPDVVTSVDRGIVASFPTGNTKIEGDCQLIVGQFTGTSRDSVLCYRPGPAPERIYLAPRPAA